MLILAIFYFRRKKFPGDNLKTAIVSADNLDCNQRNNLLKMCNIISSIDVVAVAKNFREVIGKFKPKDVAITNFLKNDAKNRYGGENGVPCYDKNRVILQNRKNDYIHASWINFPTSRRYICTQGPLEKKDGNDSTIDDFWTMCLQQKVQFVVMLCNPVEDMDEKCDVYYPVSENSVMKLENMKVVCKSLSTTKLESVNWRVLEVSDKNMKKDKPLLINHLQVMWWPDHSIPDQSDLVVKLLDVLHKDNKDPNPIVVHCSAGVGRTGTFVLIDYALDQIKNVEDVTISGCFEFIRSNRAKAVQEDVQYIFVYHAIMRYCVMKDIVKESDMQKFSRIYRDFKEKHKKKMEKINQKMAAQKK
ncbi:unnamed protein product [Caenorhabditis angaria]|uniref:Protein-tyrosine-phosphatase n=1 Tax=Caenorhabditis angaria TaxID=860376 RepID=A0A9P1IE64_9PELO|nr:unnamed protein product [Caenorhabditis angaria]